MSSYMIEWMREHRIKQLFVRFAGVVQPQFLILWLLAADEIAQRRTCGLRDLFQRLSRRRCLQVLDDLGLDTPIADHGQRVAGGAALRVMVDGDFAHAAAFPGLDGLLQRHA